MAARVIKAVVGLKPYVIGKNMAIPVVADMPGTAPRTTPTMEPMVIHSRFSAVKSCKK